MGYCPHEGHGERASATKSPVHATLPPATIVLNPSKTYEGGRKRETHCIHPGRVERGYSTPAKGEIRVLQHDAYLTVFAGIKRRKYSGPHSLILVWEDESNSLTLNGNTKLSFPPA
jgi:hypothetical protein